VILSPRSPSFQKDAPSRDRAAGILTETAALAKKLHNIVENDRYTFSPRIGTLARRLSRSALAS
jgi:hypothetical protein